MFVILSSSIVETTTVNWWPMVEDIVEFAAAAVAVIGAIYALWRFIRKKLLHKDSEEKPTIVVNVTAPSQPVEPPSVPQLPADRFPTHLPATINQKVYRPRTDDRNKVTERMAKGQQVVVSGIGGIGKTTLARDLFFRQAEHYDYACWVNYNATLEDSLCAAFHLFEDAAMQAEKLANIVAFLRNDKTKLLVVDNADETIEKSPLLRELVARKQIQLVLTARTGDIAGFEAYPLDFLSPEECKALFYGYCDSMSDGDEAETVAELIKEVSCHTLALELLAKAKPRGQTLKAFFQRLKKDGFGFPDMNVRTTHQEQVAQTVAEHLHKLYRMESLPEEQQRILRNLVFVPTMPIPAQVNEWISCKENDLNDLIRLGWLTASGAYYFMHPIVKQTILLDKSEFQKDTGTEFVDYLGYHNRYIEENEHYTTAIPKLELAEGFLTEWLSWSGAQTKQAASACNELDCRWSDLGDYHKALNWGKKGLEIKEKILPNTNSLATSYNNVGVTYGYLGDHSKELKYKLKALNIREAVLPANHPDLAASYNNVGFAYGNLGDWKEAVKYLEKALNIREKVLPANHPDLAQSYNNVGYAYGKLGDPNKELEYKLKALNIWEGVLPANHPDLALSYNNVGSAYGKLGDHNKELEYKLKALNIREAVLPANHPALATSYNNVGYAYGELGDHNKKLEYYQKALNIWEEVLPANHPDLALSYNNVGSAYGKLGDHTKRLEYQKKALAINEKALPDNHPDLAMDYANVGVTLHQLDRNEEARTHLLKAEAIYRERPECKPSLSVVYFYLSAVESDLGNDSAAAEYKAKEKAIDAELQS